jgi:hypothetical protein
LSIDDEALDRVVSELRTYGAVALLGAGISYLSGYPLGGDLQALVWHAVETEPETLQAVATEIRVPVRSAKDVIGDSEEHTTVAFRAIASHENARRAFQQGFAALDRDRRPYGTRTHDAMARLLHSRVVERIVSLNWDTATQHAHLRRYGRFPKAGEGEFAKPHGDASDPDSPWILPHEPGGIPRSLQEGLERMAAERPRVLLIAGYSERDEGIVNQLIAPLERRWRVVRVGPSADGPLSLRGEADEVLPALASRLVQDPELPGWEYVVFEDQRDLGPALLGESLGPRDVIACPELPEVEEVVRNLRVAGVGVLRGESGSGKSITVYQSAFSFHEQDWG